MKTLIKLEEEDYNHMHDVILEALGIEPTKEQIKEYFFKLPDDIIGLAVQWGSSDTVFRDNMFTWLQENINNNATA